MSSCWGLRTDDWGQRTEDVRLWTDDWGLKTKDRGLRHEDWEMGSVRTEDSLHTGGCQTGWADQWGVVTVRLTPNSDQWRWGPIIDAVQCLARPGPAPHCFSSEFQIVSTEIFSSALLGLLKWIKPPSTPLHVWLWWMVIIQRWFFQLI